MVGVVADGVSGALPRGCSSYKCRSPGAPQGYAVAPGYILLWQREQLGREKRVGALAVAMQQPALNDTLLAVAVKQPALSRILPPTSA